MYIYDTCMASYSLRAPMSQHRISIIREMYTCSLIIIVIMTMITIKQIIMIIKVIIKLILHSNNNN